MEGGRRPFSHVQYEAPGWLLMSAGPILPPHTHNRNNNSPSATLLHSDAGMKHSGVFPPSASFRRPDRRASPSRCSEVHWFTLARLDWWSEDGLI